jgi:predicted Zn-dependent protease
MLLSMARASPAMIAGAGEAGQAILMAGQQIAQRTFMAFSRTVEASADQAGMRFLTATHPSGMGCGRCSERFQDQRS